MSQLTADEQIAKCLVLGQQNSFMLKAGAGSGKTRSLVSAVRHTLEINGEAMGLSGARIAVITYTRAARDEIQRRLDYDARVSVSTIHSFAWTLIKPHTGAIKAVRASMLRAQTEELRHKESRARRGSASVDRLRRIARNMELLERLPDIRVFQYSPESNIPGLDELNHHEVIEILAQLLVAKPLLSQILVAKFPYLFIDEVQDTAKSIVPPLLEIEERHNGWFTLGFFGDTMQRIYLDGIPDLPSLIPPRWIVPEIRDNYRSGSRIVDLANGIRGPVDGSMQTAKQPHNGLVRLFIADSSLNRLDVEGTVRRRMVEVASDSHQSIGTSPETVTVPKILVLEHSLAAHRLGFSEFSACFPRGAQKDDLYGQGSAGSPQVNYLGTIADLISTIVEERLWQADNMIASMRADSYRFETEEATEARLEWESKSFGSLRVAARGLKQLIERDKDACFLSVLDHIRSSRLFVLPIFILDIMDLNRIRSEAELADDNLIPDNNQAWLDGLRLSWKQFYGYYNYINGRSMIDTHQGVKGLEFKHVMLVLDDSRANGNLFSFEKLLGTKELSDTDRTNLLEGKETSVDRTRRLFYVSCTRARDTLGIVYYTADPGASFLNNQIQSWFTPDEVEVLSLARTITD